MSVRFKCNIMVKVNHKWKYFLFTAYCYDILKHQLPLDACKIKVVLKCLTTPESLNHVLVYAWERSSLYFVHFLPYSFRGHIQITNFFIAHVWYDLMLGPLKQGETNESGFLEIVSFHVE